MSETWVWNDIVSGDLSSVKIQFIVDANLYNSIHATVETIRGDDVTTLWYDNEMAYNSLAGFDVGQTITFLTAPTGSLLTYLQANATKQETGGGVGLKNLSSYNQDLSIPRKKDLDALEVTIADKQDKITGGASTIATSNLTTNRALISNSSGKVAVSSVSSTELGYLDGVTNNVQTQLNGIRQLATDISDTYYYAEGTLSDGNIDIINSAEFSDDLQAFKSTIIDRKVKYGDFSRPCLICQSSSDGAMVVLRLTDMEDISGNPLYIFTAYYFDSEYYYAMVRVNGDGVAEFSERQLALISINGQTGDVEITASNIGAVPTSRTVNGKALSSNITLSASDVDAIAAKNGTGTGTTSLEDLTVTDGVEIGYNNAKGGGLYGYGIINIKSPETADDTSVFTLNAGGPNNTNNTMDIYSGHTQIVLDDGNAERTLTIHAPESQSGLTEDGVIVDGLANLNPDAAGTNYRNSPLTGAFYTDSIKPYMLPVVTTADNGKFLRVVNGAWAADTVLSAGGVGF